METLKGRVAIVNGGGAGIGRGVASALVAAGAGVVLMGRRPEPLEETRRELARSGGEVAVVAGDVGKLTDIEQCLSTAIDRFGRLDVLVNNAQTYRHAALLDATDETAAKNAIESLSRVAAVEWGGDGVRACS